ncbi:hypothetical protein OWR28_08675 [Chryseobacterium sp. 1B4]
MDKALQLTLPPSNQNYFGIQEQVQVRLKKAMKSNR